jgi:putative oxidoreductase
MSSSSSSECSASSAFAPLFLRLALGIMIFPHGAQKLLGWFGGYGFSGTVQFLTGGMHIPWIFAVAAILIEFFGGIALILGLFTRLAAFLVGLELVIAAFMVHVRNGFFMNWGGQQKGEGFEFFILVAGIALALMLLGGGCCSLDKARCKEKASEPTKT